MLRATGRDGQAGHRQPLQAAAGGGWTYSHLGLGSAASPQDTGRETTVGARLGGCLGKLAHLSGRFQVLTACQLVPAHREPARSVTESQGPGTKMSRSLFRGHKTQSPGLWSTWWWVWGQNWAAVLTACPRCPGQLAPGPVTLTPHSCTSPWARWASKTSDQSRLNMGSTSHDCTVQACRPPSSSATGPQGTF